MSRLITGRVSSNSGDKTIVVKVDIRKVHPLYKKQYTQHRKFMAHDEKNASEVGDLVAIRESSPISRHKRFVLEKIIEHTGAGFDESVAAADVPEELKAQSPESSAKKEEELSAKDSKLSAKATKGSDK